MNIVKILLTRLQCLRYGINYQKGLWIHPSFRAIKSGEIKLGECTALHNLTRIDCNGIGHVTIGKGCKLNWGTQIESMSEVFIGDYVLIAPNVHITDRNHEYKDISIPIIKQGWFSNGVVKIDDGCWIGINTVIIGPVHIGRNCVIGANSVVTKDIPDYSVSVGNPARIIRRYNFETQLWERV